MTREPPRPRNAATLLRKEGSFYRARWIRRSGRRGCSCRRRFHRQARRARLFARARRRDPLAVFLPPVFAAIRWRRASRACLCCKILQGAFCDIARGVFCPGPLAAIRRRIRSGRHRRSSFADSWFSSFLCHRTAGVWATLILFFITYVATIVKCAMNETAWRKDAD